ncbi:hypothetical protein [Bosea sp. BK604]|uniref:hypothetical protein n=1 Tax=Bosea sp. BK604 TaxID=2512180 RepID=UPI001051C7BB|nr:hypothetical protein [Bosea sp. BK604]TCR70486.1 hypothetical protein EV560_101893 [Bosea sp. BK604]
MRRPIEVTGGAREHSYALRPTWPGEPSAEDDYLVIDEDGEQIARISRDTSSTTGRWLVNIQGTGGLPIYDGVFNTLVPSFEAAKAKVCELWPIFRAHLTDEEYERSRRMRREMEEAERNV